MHAYLYFHVPDSDKISLPLLLGKLGKSSLMLYRCLLGTLACHCGTVECPPGIRGAVIRIQVLFFYVDTISFSECPLKSTWAHHRVRSWFRG